MSGWVETETAMGILEFRRKRDLGPLHRLLLRASPPDDDGVHSIKALAAAIGISVQSIYKMIEKEKVSAEKAVRIVGVSQGRVSIEDFHPYVFKS